MKKITFFILFFLFSFQLLSQPYKSNPYGDKYDDKNFNGLKVVQVIDISGFIPLKLTKDVRQFKSVLLQLSDRAYTQLNIDTWSLCSFKHEQYFQIYNMYYKPVTKSFYDENCKALIALMLMDGTIIQPR